MKKLTANCLLLTITLSLMTACESQDDDRLKQKSQIEGSAQAEEQYKRDKAILEEQIRKQKELQEEQLKAQRDLQEEQLRKEKEAQQKLQEEQFKKERQAQDKRSKEMELDLAKRFEFFEDNSGHYEGVMTRGAEKYNIRISLFPSIAKYTGTRVRTPTEVETDLTALSYNVQIVQWLSENPQAAVGCRVEKLIPNIKKQTLNIITTQCTNSYFFTLNRTTVDGTVQPSSNPNGFNVHAELVQKKK